MPNLKGWEWLIIIALILILFGAKRLPDAARGLGRSLRIFKAETKGLVDDGAAGAAAAGATAAGTAVPPAAPAAPIENPPAAPAAADPAAQQAPNPERSEG